MSKHRTLRVTEFKGLNKSENPHNIDDAELVTLENMFVTKNRGLESRKGYRRLGDVDDSYYIKGLYTTAWSKTDDRLYYVGNGFLAKMDDDGVDTYISPIDAWGKTTQFDRYHDKVLMLNEQSYLQWFNSDENIERVKYPELSVGNFYGPITTSDDTDSLLDVDTIYEYCISVVLGDDYLDGMSPGSRPYTQGGGEFPSWTAHAYVQTHESTLKKVVATALPYTISLHGYNIGAVRLYRRISKEGTTGTDAFLTGDAAWRRVSEAYISLNVADGTYEFSHSDTTVVTDITGTYDSVDDKATLSIDFTDNGTTSAELESPWLESDVAQVRAYHMGRLYNRIFLANIVGTGQTRDSKKVYYSYRGWREALNEYEIPDVAWEHPMLIFPQTNYFYCDAEDTEDPITAIRAFRDSIIVFTERCMFLWREGMGDPIKISGDVGCISKRTIVEFEGKLIWLSHTGIFEYNGSTLKNLTAAKMQPYMDDLPGPYAQNCTACVFDRKYFIAGPFEGGTQANMMLVYDYDVESWHARKYKIGSDEECRIDMIYTDRDGADEQMWAGLKDPSANVIIAEMEQGYLDQQNPAVSDDSLGIACTIKTKYYSLNAPDIEKAYRDLYLDADNYYGDIELDVYVDDLVTAKESFTHRNNVDGFTLGSATLGVLGTSALKSLSDEIFRFSLPRGLIGSRMQYAADLIANTAPLNVHMIGFNWTPRRGLKRKYGA